MNNIVKHDFTKKFIFCFFLLLSTIYLLSCQTITVNLEVTFIKAAGKQLNRLIHTVKPLALGQLTYSYCELFSHTKNTVDKVQKEKNGL